MSENVAEIIKIISQGRQTFRKLLTFVFKYGLYAGIIAVILQNFPRALDARHSWHQVLFLSCLFLRHKKR